MANINISVKTESGVKTTTDRFDSSIKTYQANVFATSLAQEKKIANHPNPRDPKSKSDETLIEALEDTSSPDVFHLAANGVYLFANKVKVVEDQLEITFSDKPKDLEGMSNGQHLYKAVLESFENGSLPESKRIPVTIYTGLDKVSKLKIVYGLNNNVAVNEDSHMNMAGKFNLIKKVLKDTPYTEEYVSYYQNDNGVQSILGILQLLKCMTPGERDFDFKDPSIPKSAYGNAQVIRNDFRDNKTIYDLMSRALPEILRFRDVVQAGVDHVIADSPNVRKAINLGNKPLALTGFRGKTPTTNPFQYAQFGGAYPEYILNNGALYPLLSAFRVFVNDLGDFDFDGAMNCWADIGDDLVNFVIRGCEDHEEVRKFASADTTWINLISMVKNWADRNKYLYRVVAEL